MSFAAIGGGVAAGVVGGALSGGSGGGGGNLRAEEFGVSNGGLFNPFFNKKKGLDDINFGISGPIADLQNQMVQGAGGLFNQGQGFVDQLNQTDPFAVAQQQFNLLNPILQQQQEQDFLDLEGRLFNQGQLGSGGNIAPGQTSLNAFFDSSRDAERQLLFDSLGLGFQAQQHQLGIGQGLFGLGNNQLLGALGINQGAANTAAVAGGIAGTGGGGVSPLSPLQSFGQGLQTQGFDQIGGAFNGLFNPTQGFDFSTLPAGLAGPR